MTPNNQSNLGRNIITASERHWSKTHAPAAHGPADANGKRPLFKFSLQQRRLAISEEPWVVHVLVGVTVFFVTLSLWRGKNCAVSKSALQWWTRLKVAES